MRLLKLGAVALLLRSTCAFLNTSPFFMFSTSELLSSTRQLQTASAITSDISRTLSECPSDFYILVHQPGVTSKDYRSKKATPALAQRLSSNPPAQIRSSLSIPEVIGEVDLSIWRDLLQTTCNVRMTEIDASTGEIPTTYEMMPQLVNVYLPSPSLDESKRAEEILQNDDFLASILDLLPSKNYTVLYTTIPYPSSQSGSTGDQWREYNMESLIQESLHMDLKRDLGLHTQKKGNQTMIDGPLFEKYQFFTPGIFMGFMVGLILLLILYVAISGVASLQVSYAAFEKESGPQSAKKQQ